MNYGKEFRKFAMSEKGVSGLNLDYFEKHIDRPKQDDNRYLSGGIELSDKSDFEGGQFVVKNIPILFEKGKLLTHKVTDSHEITKLKKGTRWSLHFGINKLKTIL